MSTDLPPSVDPRHAAAVQVVPDVGAGEDDVLTGALPAAPSRSLFRRGVDVFLENKLALIGLAFIVVALLFCFVGPSFYHTDQVHTNLANEDLAPGPGHPLGTDENGYDQLGRLMIGGQMSLEIGIAAALLSTVLGALWGAIAGYFGGALDSAMMRVVDAGLSLPQLFLLLFAATLVTPSTGSLIVVLAFISWLSTARLIRGESISLRMREYVQAVRMMGGTGFRVISRHIVPNTVGTLAVTATFQVADAITTVAAASYLGLGVPPPQTDWGGMLAAGTNYVTAGYWWLIYPPGIAIILVVIAFNFIGDGLRDALEVRLQRR